jgi:hypothetical protein
MEVSGQLYSWGNSPQYLFDMGLGGPQNQPGCGDKVNKRYKRRSNCVYTFSCKVLGNHNRFSYTETIEVKAKLILLL